MKVHKRLHTPRPDCDKCVWEVVGTNFEHKDVYYPTTYCGHADYEDQFIDKIQNIEWENAGYTKDDACDAYIVYAEWLDGTELNDDELEELSNDYDAQCYYAESLYDAQIDNLSSIADCYKDS